MYTIYNVSYGDTLDKIANYFATDVETLRQINDFRGDYRASFGDQIIVPSIKKDRFITYTIKKGDNLYEIARRYNIDVNTLLLINGLNKDDYIYPNQEIIIPTKDTKFYMTKNGDTLSGLLKDTNLTINELLDKNKEIYLLPEQMIILD